MAKEEITEAQIGTSEAPTVQTTEAEKREAELAAREQALKEKEEALLKAEALFKAKQAEATGGEDKNAGTRWTVLRDCYAKGALYHEGDTVKGGDFTGNPNFKKL